MRYVPLFTTALALALGCRPVETPEQQAARIAQESQAAKQAIDAKDATWARLSAAGHSDSLALNYAAAAVLLPPNMSPVRGRDAIRAFFGVLNTMSSPPPTLAVWAESVWANGPVAVELGRWTFTWPAGAKRPPGAPAVDSGKYLVRWVNERGQWLMAQDIWNSDTPLPAPGGSGPRTR